MEWLPKDIDTITMAFPANVSDLMPPMDALPEEFVNSRHPMCRLFSTWFFRGLTGHKFTPREGIDGDKALRHVSTVMRSFEPKHEHKEAACAWLLNEWFSKIESKEITVEGTERQALTQARAGGSTNE